MKNIASLSVDISNFSEQVIDNLIKAQRSTAKDLYKDVKTSAPVNTGAYKDSIQLSETTYDGNVIRTSVYTDAMVYDSLGRGYNLGELIETGTRPHIIEPAIKQKLAFQVDEIDPRTGEKKWVYTDYVFHPGTIAYPHFKMSLEAIKPLYEFNIRKAIKEAKL